MGELVCFAWEDWVVLFLILAIGVILRIIEFLGVI